MSATLDAALYYLSKGWSPTPVPPPTAAVGPTADDLRRAWEDRPDANVGVHLGPASGLIGIDVKGADGDAMLLSWAGGADNVTPTLAFRTPNGRHLLYAIPAGVSVAVRSFGVGGKETVRVLGRGSLTLMPPSRLADGSYEWVEGAAPWERDAAVAPAWLLPHLILGGDDPFRERVHTPPLTVIERACQYLHLCDVARGGRTGEDQALRVAEKIAVGFGLGDDDAVEAMMQEWNPRCEPPRPREELLRHVQAARRITRHPVGYLLGDRGFARIAWPERPAPPLCAVSAAELLEEELTPPRWVIPGVVTEGGFLLGGRPKGGKSWLALQAALGLAEGTPVWGALEAPPGEALYVALEDGRGRLQSRLRSLAGDARPAGLYVMFDAPTLSAGLTESLGRWLDDHPKVKLVVIDTLTRVRDRGGSYMTDYDAVEPLSVLGRRYGVAVVIVHHTRKPTQREEDPFDAISGSMGLLGGADTLAVLRRPPHAEEAKLDVRGRDAGDQTLRLVWEAGRWRLHQGEDLPPEQKRVVEVLTGLGRAVTPVEFAPLLGKSYETTRKLLRRMSDEGRIKSVRNRFEAWGDVPMSQSHVNP